MTFPTTGILDDFNRANEGPPPSASWVDSSGGMVVSGNEMIPDPLSIDLNQSYYNTLFSADQEAYITITQFAGDIDSAIFARFKADFSDKYFVVIDPDILGGDAITLNTDTGGTLGTYNVVAGFNDGDSFGIKCSGTAISVWYKPVAGVWSEVIAITDGTIGTAGYIGVWVDGLDVHFDNFGGGIPIVPPSPDTSTEPTVVFSQCGPEPILRINDGTEIIDLLANDSGWELDDPYWNPQIAQYKGGGSYINSGLAEGQRLVHKEYDNVIETIPLSVRGINQNRAIQTVRRLLQKARQASDYWTEPYEYNDVWIEAKPAGSDCLIGYARVIKMSIPELTNPFGQPFFSSFNEAIMNGITLTVEREPLWRGVPPGEIIGPLYNLIKNPDFELWNFGTVDSQPDSWTDLETIQITGQNSRELTSPHSGQASLKIRVSSSTLAGRIKGVTQAIENIEDNTEYTVIAWVRSEGVSNGVGRILVTYSGQLEVYRVSTRHDWQLYTGKFTTGMGDSVAINLEILTTAANTDGTIYVDSLMLLEGDWETEAANDTLPYLSSSHVLNHWDQDTGKIEAGDINWLDVWNVPGDEDALIRLEAQNNTTPADLSNIVEKIAIMRIGQRRLASPFIFQNTYDPPGATDTDCASDTRLTTVPTPSWNDVTVQSISGGTLARGNEGRFRVFARLKDNNGTVNLQARLKYWLGTAAVNVKYLDSVVAPIVGNWCLVNLTENAAMIWDRKLKENPVGGLGYALQLSRPTGAGSVYLDYLLALPTDGGYAEVTFDPPVSRGSGLVVDNTTTLDISAQRLDQAGPKISYQSTIGENSIQDVIVFNGEIYIGSIDAFSQGYIRRLHQDTWSLIHTDARGFNAFGNYNGSLYAGVSGALIGTYDGVTWSDRISFGVESPFALIAFNGYLWIGAFAGLAAGKIYYSDGSSLTLSHVLLAGGETITCFEVYGGKLYAGSSAGNLYIYDNGVWSSSASGETTIDVLRAFNGFLFAATSNTGKILRFDGQSWITSYQFPAPFSSYHLERFDNALYAAGFTSATVKTIDGINWTEAFELGSINISILSNETGTFYIGSIVGGVATIYVYATSDVVGKIADFSGTPFTSPPEIRHRWVFSFDRPGYVNNVNDRILVGLGFVPRYLALRGAN